MSTHNIDLLLIYPPIAKPAEPPAGVAQIKQAMEDFGHSCTVIDANIEAQLYLINSVERAGTPRLLSALNNREKNLHTIRTISAFNKFDHSKRIGAKCSGKWKLCFPSSGDQDAQCGCDELSAHLNKFPRQIWLAIFPSGPR